MNKLIASVGRSIVSKQGVRGQQPGSRHRHPFASSFFLFFFLSAVTIAASKPTPLTQHATHTIQQGWRCRLTQQQVQTDGKGEKRRPRKGTRSSDEASQTHEMHG